MSRFSIAARHRMELELHTMPYHDYLQTEHWKHMRALAFQNAAFKCQVCNAGGSLQVHHRTYERRGCEYLADLSVLCAECHALFHAHGKLAEAA